MCTLTWRQGTYSSHTSFIDRFIRPDPNASHDVMGKIMERKQSCISDPRRNVELLCTDLSGVCQGTTTKHLRFPQWPRYHCLKVVSPFTATHTLSRRQGPRTNVCSCACGGRERASRCRRERRRLSASGATAPVPLALPSLTLPNTASTTCSPLYHAFCFRDV